MTAKILLPLLSMIASVSDSELAQYVKSLKGECKFMRSRISNISRTVPWEHDSEYRKAENQISRIEPEAELLPPTL